MGRGMKCCSIGKRAYKSEASSRRVSGTTRREWLSVEHASPNYRSELRFSECGGKERERARLSCKTSSEMEQMKLREGRL